MKAKFNLNYLLCCFLYFALFGKVLIDAIAVRVLPLEVVLYAGFSVLVIFVVCAYIFHQRLFVGGYATLIAFLIATWFLIGFYEGNSVRYIFGDAMTLILPLMLYQINRHMQLTQRLGLFRLLVGVLFLSAILSLLVGQEASGRFDPPAIMLVSFVAVNLFYSGQFKSFAIPAFGLVFCLVLWSGNRTTLILALMAPLLVVFLRTSAKYYIVFLVLVIMALVPFLSDIFQYFVESRFKSIVSGEGDLSLMVRAYEAMDVVGNMREAHWVYFIFGNGHGAEYIPYLANTEHNSLPNGNLHHIHILPFLILYRYGLIGLFIYFGILGKLFTAYCKLFIQKPREIGVHDKIGLVYLISCILYVFDGFLRNVLVDPVFSIVIAGFFWSQSVQLVSDEKA